MVVLPRPKESRPSLRGWWWCGRLLGARVVLERELRFDWRWRLGVGNALEGVGPGLSG